MDFWLTLNGALLTALVILLGRRIFFFLRSQKKNVTSSRLHLKLSALFLLISLTPAIFIAVFSLLFFHYGVQTWFSNQIKTAVTESQEIAQSYLKEHQNAIRADLLAMASDIDIQADSLTFDTERLDKIVNTQAFIRNLSEALIFDQQGRTLARSSLAFTLDPQTVPDYARTRAEQGDVVLFDSFEDDRVRALIKLKSFSNAYLAVGRLVDPTVLARVNRTRDAAEKYKTLESQYSGLRQTLTLTYVALAIFLTGVAVWLGLNLARYLIIPIENMVEASEKIRAGDFSTHVKEKTRLEEFNILAKSFNRMVGQIQKQQTELMVANREMDERRRFTEAVLADVSSGVFSVDNKGIITLSNKAACDLLQMESEVLTGAVLNDIMPSLRVSIEDKNLWNKNTLDVDIPYTGQKGKKLDLIVKVVAEKEKALSGSMIVTFDDISALKSAQKKAAWSDVARRIAHEIKNPLTPIQLSAERIHKRFAKYVPDEEKDVFEKCISTIGKHVEDIGHMVTEFSDFARMPQPILKRSNIKTLINEVAIMQGEAYPNIVFKRLGLLKENNVLRVVFDTQQVRQAVLNLVQNAVDSLVESKVKNPEIYLCLTLREPNQVVLVVGDNGLGFPEDTAMDNLTDPYVTRKAKGTGLGLAIVKKIMEDHGGELILGKKKWMSENRDIPEAGDAGAIVALHFPLQDNTLSNNNDSEAA